MSTNDDMPTPEMVTSMMAEMMKEKHWILMDFARALRCSVSTAHRMRETGKITPLLWGRLAKEYEHAFMHDHWNDIPW